MRFKRGYWARLRRRLLDAKKAQQKLAAATAMEKQSARQEELARAMFSAGEVSGQMVALAKKETAQTALALKEARAQVQQAYTTWKRPSKVRSKSIHRFSGRPTIPHRTMKKILFGVLIGFPAGALTVWLVLHQARVTRSRNLLRPPTNPHEGLHLTKEPTGPCGNHSCFTGSNRTRAGGQGFGSGVGCFVASHSVGGALRRLKLDLICQPGSMPG